MKFSIITTTHNRAHMIHRAVLSIAGQTWDGESEHIIVDDCSDDNTEELVKSIPFPWIKYLKTPFHGDRVRAYNLGLQNATGDWICMLDSDDMYVTYYLELLSEAILRAPESKIFNFGGINIHKNYAMSMREPFRPARKGKGHEIFRAGTIAMGHFIFKRELLDEIGYLPETNNCWEFAEEFKAKHPEILPLYKPGQELGNPWGNDYALFYELTRKHYSIPLPFYLYVVWGREEKEFPV